MARISFRAKVQTMRTVEGEALYRYLQVPEFKRAHCDMGAFRTHAKYGAYANSDLFPGVLRRIRADVFGGRPLRLDQVPDGVSVDETGFLAEVSIVV